MNFQVSTGIIVFFIFIFSSCTCSGQENSLIFNEKQLKRDGAIFNYDERGDPLFILKEKRKTKMDSLLLFSYHRNNEIAPSSFPLLYMHNQLFFLDKGWSNLNVMGSYKPGKIDCNKWKNLDYRVNQPEYDPNKPEFLGILLFMVATKRFSNQEFMFSPKKEGY
jgi:hypothetical protein